MREVIKDHDDIGGNRTSYTGCIEKDLLFLFISCVKEIVKIIVSNKKHHAPCNEMWYCSRHSAWYLVVFISIFLSEKRCYDVMVTQR